MPGPSIRDGLAISGRGFLFEAKDLVVREISTCYANKEEREIRLDSADAIKDAVGECYDCWLQRFCGDGKREGKEWEALEIVYEELRGEVPDCPEDAIAYCSREWNGKAKEFGKKGRGGKKKKREEKERGGVDEDEILKIKTKKSKQEEKKKEKKEKDGLTATKQSDGWVGVKPPKGYPAMARENNGSGGGVLGRAGVGGGSLGSGSVGVGVGVGGSQGSLAPPKGYPAPPKGYPAPQDQIQPQPPKPAAKQPTVIMIQVPVTKMPGDVITINFSHKGVTMAAKAVVPANLPADRKFKISVNV